MIKLKQIIIKAHEGGNFLGTLEMTELKVNSVETRTYRSTGAGIIGLTNGLIEEFERAKQGHVRYGIVKIMTDRAVSYGLEKVEVLGPSHTGELCIYVDKNGSRFTGNPNDFYRTEDEARKAIETKKLQDQKCSNQV